MGCTHVPDCPLFPKLNASLRGWRDAYCDSDSAWRDCARYRQSNTGRAVPLTLLPNGRLAQTITRSRVATASPSRFATAPVQLPAADPDSPFEREPLGPEPVARPDGGSPWAGAGPVAAPVRRPVVQAPAPPGPRPGRWARLVAWMRGAV
jgi:hypothetical protein